MRPRTAGVMAVARFGRRVLRQVDESDAGASHAGPIGIGIRPTDTVIAGLRGRSVGGGFATSQLRSCCATYRANEVLIVTEDGHLRWISDQLRFQRFHLSTSPNFRRHLWQSSCDADRCGAAGAGGGSLWNALPGKPDPVASPIEVIREFLQDALAWLDQ